MAEIEVDEFWLVCPVCGDYMNIPIFDPNTGKAYHKWCIPNTAPLHFAEEIKEV